MNLIYGFGAFVLIMCVFLLGNGWRTGLEESDV